MIPPDVNAKLAELHALCVERNVPLIAALDHGPEAQAVTIASYMPAGARVNSALAGCAALLAPPVEREAVVNVVLSMLLAPYVEVRQSEREVPQEGG